MFLKFRRRTSDTAEVGSWIGTWGRQGRETGKTCIKQLGEKRKEQKVGRKGRT